MFNWPLNQRCAVSLTYDDGRKTHCKAAVPLLNKYGLKGTFYVDSSSKFFRRRPYLWKKVAEAGHELGNHGLFHSCRRIESRKEWLKPYLDLCEYTPDRFEEELQMANFILYLIDGKKKRTYGNTCWDITIGRGKGEVSMDAILRKNFIAARGPLRQKPARIDSEFNLMQVGTLQADGKTFSDLQRFIVKATFPGSWVVLTIHGVQEDGPGLFLESKEHRRLIEWLSAQRNNIWTAPFIEVARYVRDRREKKS